MSVLAARLRSLFVRAREPDARRWVVLDVEASGFDARRDRLLAIAAVGVHFGRPGAAPAIAFGDSFEVVLRQDETLLDRDNILLHGIGVGAQRAGAEARQALQGFASWLGDAPVVGFHAAFDRRLIQRAMLREHGRRFANRWLDLEPIAAAVYPGVAGRSLDDWLAHFGIACAMRHQAAADALATAELMLRLWPAIAAQCDGGSLAELAALADQARWLAR